MAKRKISNKRSSRYSRGSNGSNVLNPDTNIFDDEQPYWWRNLENNTIVTRSTNSANFNQTSRRLDPNSSIESNNGLDDGWWKVLEGTPRNLKSLQKGNDLSKQDANDGASRISESEEEVKIAKKKPQLRPVAKKVDGNAFLCALKDPRVLLIPLEKDISIAQRFLSTSQISNDSKQPNKDSDTKLRMTEHGNDLFNCPLPKATSTPLEGSIASHGSSVGNSNSDTELILKKKKPKSKLLRRHNRDTKKNLFEDILMEEDQTEVEEAAHRPSANASAVVDESAKERKPRIVENKSKLEDANQRLHPTEKADHQDSGNNSSDTTYEFLQPTKPKTRFLGQTRRTPRENLFQRILSDSDSPSTKATSNLSQNRNSTQTVRRPSMISTESNEEVNLKLSNSSNSSDVDIIRTRNNVVSSSPDRHVEIASSQPEDGIFDAVRTSRERSVLSNENEKDRNLSHSYRTQLFSDSDEEEDDKASDVTLLTMASKSLSGKTRSTISSEITTQPEVHLTQQSQKNSAAYEEAYEKDSAVAESAYDASDIEFRDLNRSRKRSISRRDQEIAAEEAAMSQRSLKSQKHASSANFNQDRTSSEMESSARTSLRGQGKRSTTAQQRISSTVNDGQTSELDTPRQSKKFKAARRTSEMENVRTPERKSRDAVKDSKFRDLNRSRTRSMSRGAQEIVAEEAAMSQRSMKSQKHTSPANFNEDSTSSEEELLSRSSQRWQSKRSTTAQQRISSTANDKQPRELDTPRRSKRSEAVQRTSETENVRTFEQEQSSPANFNEDRTSSEEELLSRSFQRRQSKRSTTAQQRISSTASDEQPRELDTSRRSKRSAAGRRTSETKSVRTPEKESRDAVKDSKFRDLIRPRTRSISRSAQEIAAEETAMSTMKSQGRSSPANFNEDRTSSEAERSPRTSLRWQSKRSTTAQQRISSTAIHEQPRELENLTPRRSKRSEAVRKTSETENVRTLEKESGDAVKDSEFRDLNRSRDRSMSRNAQEIAAEESATRQSTMKSQGRSTPANLNEDRTSSEAERSPRTSLRWQSKRSTTAQQRISSTAIHEQPRELENLTPRRSKRSEAVRKTSETENVRTLEKESGDAVKDSEFRDLNRSRDRSMSRNAQEIAAEESATRQSPMKSLGRLTPANFNEDRTSSEVGLSARTSLRWQSKRSTTAQQRISSTANDGQTRELGNITPRRSKRSEAVRKTSETENVRTLEKESGDAVKDSEFRDLNRSRDRSMSRNAQEIAAEESATSQSPMKSLGRSSPANYNKDRTSSEAERSPRTSLRWQSKRSITGQQRISSTASNEQPRELATPRRSKKFKEARRTSETENVRTPERQSRGAVKDSEFRDLNTSRDRSMSRSAQEIAAEETAMSTMESQDRSSPADLNEDRLSSVGEPSTSITAQQRISFTPNDGQTRELGNITPRRSKTSAAVRKTCEKENVRTPEKESRGAAKDSELEGALQSRRSRHNLIEEAEETPPLYRPGSGKARSSAAPPRGQKVLEDFFKTNATAIPASEALSDPQMAQEIRKKLDEMKKRELQKMEEIGKLAVAEKKKKSGKGLRPKPNQLNPVPKKVDKAYLVNGVVYKRPSLPRPKKWVTDHLYRYLWKQMEPTYKLETRVQSENFVRRLSEVCDVILKRKTYETYKDLLYALMKEMARLQIISTRFDFYNFCHDFLPYELRAKMVPILLPGNMRTIPYNPKKLYDPLISP